MKMLKAVRNWILFVAVCTAPLHAETQSVPIETCTENPILTAKFTACSAMIEAAAQSDPEIAGILAARAAAYRQIGDSKSAIRDLDRAIALDPEMAAAYAMRGAAHQDQGDPAKAIADYDRAMTLGAPKSTVQSNRASARCSLGEIEGAVSDWQEVINAGAWPAKDAQAWLKEQGFYKSAIDGKFGQGSRRALTEWVEAGCP